MSEGPDRSQQSDEDRRAQAEQEPTGPTIRDRRRIDPQTGQVRPTQDTAPGGPAPGPATDTDLSGAAAGSEARVAELEAALADRTADLQRLQAEYVNYKRRIDRDRDLARTGGVEAVLRDLLTVLDNIRSAREHEELSAGFRAVADDVERVASRHGLEAFGNAGDPFDPHVHEALMHSHATEVDGVPITGPTSAAILQPGYKIKDKVIRPARVAVAEPAGEGPAPAETSSPADGSAGTDVPTGGE